MLRDPEFCSLQTIDTLILFAYVNSSFFTVVWSSDRVYTSEKVAVAEGESANFEFKNKIKPDPVVEQESDAGCLPAELVEAFPPFPWAEMQGLRGCFFQTVPSRYVSRRRRLG